MAAAVSGAGTVEEAAMEEWIEIEARIAQHVPGAMSDHFEDGSFALYDATVLALQAPPSLRGRSLTVFHNQPVEEGSPWRRVGATVRLKLWAESLSGDRQVFDGAVRDLELVEEAPGGGGGAAP